jgi:hypothetical protein
MREGHMDRLLVTTTSNGVLVDQAGQQHAMVQWEIAEWETPYTDWLNAGKCFFLVGREAGDSYKTKIRFFSGVDGAQKETYDLDPIDTVGVCGSNPHAPTNPFNKLRCTTTFSVAPTRST